MGNSLKYFFIRNNLLLWNPTLVELSLGGNLSELYLTPPTNQDDHYSRTCFNIAPWEIHSKSFSMEVPAQLKPKPNWNGHKVGPFRIIMVGTTYKDG